MLHRFAIVLMAIAALGLTVGTANVASARWRGGGYHAGHHGGYHGGYRGGFRGGYWGYYGGGFAAGAILGGLLAAPYYYGRPYYYYDGPYYAYEPVPDDAIAYCMRRYRSYDPRTGTYLGYDGYQHPCP